MFGFFEGVTFDPSRDIPDLSGKVVLVTGGNAGLGKETVLQLAKHNPSRLYLAARNPSRAEAAIRDIKAVVPDANITFLPLNLASLKSVKEASDTFLASCDRLDLLINNAGVTACIKKELDLERLHSILKWMWIVGRPTPPRSLHHQLLLSRDIFLTEQMDMHLVWTTGRMFLKPIPRFLLEPDFWTSYLASPEPCSCFKEDVDPRSITTNTQGAAANTTGAKSDIKSVKKCNGGLRTCALGFLFSYTALIAHESDF